MEMSRECIEWIYLNDENVSKVIYKERFHETLNNYKYALDNLLRAMAKDETVDIISERFHELDSVDGERLSYVELISYIKGFEMCMKIVNETETKIKE